MVRTHNRPQAFSRCIRSIGGQSVLPRVLIISDDPADTYVENVELDHLLFRPKVKKPHWWIRHHNPFNDYFNQALVLVPDGHFVIYLDDDDILLYPDWVKTILTLNKDVLIGRFQLGKTHGFKVIGDRVERGSIGGSCVAVRSEIARKHPWPARGGGDFMFIRKLSAHYTFEYIPEIVAGVQSDLNHSWGRRKHY
jgi:glycosyltransferase involved in cell wall biosynthesis